MKNTLLAIAWLLPFSSFAQAVDWDAQARDDARHDRVVLAYDGIKPDSMVCDTTVRELADGTWMLLILAGDSREPSPQNYVGVSQAPTRERPGASWSRSTPACPVKGNLNYPEGFASKDRQWLHVVFDNNRHQAVYIAAKLPPLP